MANLCRSLTVEEYQCKNSLLMTHLRLRDGITCLITVLAASDHSLTSPLIIESTTSSLIDGAAACSAVLLAAQMNYVAVLVTYPSLNPRVMREDNCSQILLDGFSGGFVSARYSRPQRCPQRVRQCRVTVFPSGKSN